jgi:hypothetical protein
MKRMIALSCLLFAGVAIGAPGESDQKNWTKACREEVWRVYEPTSGSVRSWFPRPQKRTVLVCERRAFAKLGEQLSSVGQGGTR